MHEDCHSLESHLLAKLRTEKIVVSTWEMYSVLVLENARTCSGTD